MPLPVGPSPKTGFVPVVVVPVPVFIPVPVPVPVLVPPVDGFVVPVVGVVLPPLLLTTRNKRISRNNKNRHSNQLTDIKYYLKFIFSLF